MRTVSAAAGRGVPRHASIVGREAELELVRRFVESDRTTGGLVLAGQAGIGKTTLWEAGVDAAQELGVRVLAARASDADAELSFTGLGDLLERSSSTTFRASPLRGGMRSGSHFCARRRGCRCWTCCARSRPAAA
jgi:hypothetical protein